MSTANFKIRTRGDSKHSALDNDIGTAFSVSLTALARQAQRLAHDLQDERKELLFSLGREHERIPVKIDDEAESS